MKKTEAILKCFIYGNDIYKIILNLYPMRYYFSYNNPSLDIDNPKAVDNYNILENGSY